MRTNFFEVKGQGGLSISCISNSEKSVNNEDFVEYEY